MEELDSKLSAMPGYKEPDSGKIIKTCLKSRTDSDCGYIHQKTQKGLGYLTEMTIDTRHGIITEVDCYPASQRESDILLKYLKNPLKIIIDYTTALKRNVKNALTFRLVQPIWELSGLIPVHTTHLFIEMVKKSEVQII